MTEFTGTGVGTRPPGQDFDKSLLEINLRKTVEQRIVAHDAALAVAFEFQRAG